MINSEFYDLMYRLEYLIRYSNVPRIHDESVASHSFFVCAILMDLRDKYNFNLDRALRVAISHDMPEARTNDISHETQKLYPKIKEALAEAEEAAAKELPLFAQLGVQEYTMCTTTEAKFVHFADAIQCYQYASHEISLGNKGYMSEVVDNASRRISILREELKEYLRE